MGYAWLHNMGKMPMISVPIRMLPSRLHFLLDVVAHIYNPSTQEAEVKEYEFEARLGFIVRACLKKKK
jgi:hypothetical protein